MKFAQSLKAVLLAGLCSLAVAVQAGFYHVAQSDGAWNMVGPDGRKAFLAGVDHVQWVGHRCERTGESVHFDVNRHKYGTKAAWETNTLARLDKWGFNLLGAGCDPDLRHRGVAHTSYLDIGGKMAKRGGRFAIRPNPGDVPCGGFPNVFDPEWERLCEQVAREVCARESNDEHLVGYFIDNELAWWGEGAFDLACGLYDLTATLPPDHTARKALETFLADRGVASGTAVPPAVKTAFLKLAAERYFSVAAAAIRRADPNHLVLGCRFAGLDGAHETVWEAAGRHCDVVTFNCYPWVDLDRNDVMVGGGRQDVRFVDVLAARYAQTKRPFLVTEWSFPALDSGLPCRHGAGQRFRTQGERTRATELFARTLMASPSMVGYSYFMWVDEPYWGIRPDLPEDSNYGLLNERDEPYPLVDSLARVQKGFPAIRREGVPQPSRALSAAPSAFAAASSCGFADSSACTFTRRGGDYRLANRSGLELKGRIGGRQMFDSVSLCGVEIGSWNAMLRHELNGNPVWRDTSEVTDVRWDAARGALTVRAVGGAAGRVFALTHEIVPDATTPRFLARCVRCENLGTEPLRVEALYFRQHASYAASSVPEERPPHLWKEPKCAAWNDPASGRRWSAFTEAGDVDIFHYYVDPRTKSAHPDAGFRPAGREVVLKPGDAFEPSETSAWMIAEADAPVAQVDPFIGTSGSGHTYPGATRPFGLVQPGPDTGYGDWGHCSGYRWEDLRILGFSQTHLSGTGCSDLGDFLLLPFTGELPPGEPFGVKDPARETAMPGYYAVALTNFGVTAEITAAKRVAFHRWAFPEGCPAQVLVDLQYGAVERKEMLHGHVVSATLDFGEDGLSLSGGNVLSAWLKREAHFALRFDRRWKSYRILPPRDVREKAKRIVFLFDPPPGGVLEARIAVSTADAAGARGNLAAEGMLTFDECHAAAAAEWNGFLARADVADADRDSRIVFKTSLYHLLTQPNDLADADGRYRGADGRIAKADNGHYYSGFSLWDTFRAAHPLYTILVPERVDGFVESMLAQHRAVGYLPVIPYFGCETFCMIGNHAVPVIADAYLKGFRGFDAQEAFAAVTNSLTVTHPGKPKEDWAFYDRLGYYPYDQIKGESVSRTLECAYDDSCAARFAAALGESSAAGFFSKRAQNWRNVFDAGTMLVRGRDLRGNWRIPFDPRRIGGGGDWMPYDCTEGNAWQYTWHVLHDPTGLCGVFGGKRMFGERLDMLFADAGCAAGAESCPDASGTFGQYAHGNEPSHHVAYLYNWTDRPWLAGVRIREIARRFYSARKDGICGNDDCGQMDAWYVFASFGFYPVNPCGGDYALGAPLFQRADVRLPNGRRLTILASSLPNGKGHVKSVRLNGRRIDGPIINHADLLRGGELVFDMTDR